MFLCTLKLKSCQLQYKYSPRNDTDSQAEIVNVRQSVVVGIFDKHIAEFNLDAIDILSSKIEWQASATSAFFPRRED